MKQMSRKEFRQHFEWFGLTAHKMEPSLTVEEWNKLCEFSQMLCTRMRREYKLDPNIWRENDTWPESQEEAWESLK